MTHSNERWYSVDGQLIDNKLVFNINEFKMKALNTLSSGEIKKSRLDLRDTRKELYLL